MSAEVKVIDIRSYNDSRKLEKDIQNETNRIKNKTISISMNEKFCVIVFNDKSVS
jgi:hypothetical protein